MPSLPDLIYRAYLLVRGSRYWHWRHYGTRYRARRTEDGFTISWRGHPMTTGIPTAAERGNRPLLLLCSGPSVGTIEDPTQIWSQTTLAMNGSHQLYGGNDQVFAYYLVSDIGFIRRQWDSFVRGASVSKTLLLDHRVIAEVLSHSAEPLRDKPILCFNMTHRPYGRPLETPSDHPEQGFHCRDGIVFSTNPDLGLSPSKTVAYLALELGVTLGYRDIRFLGLDLGGEGRFYAEDRAEKTMIADDFSSFIEPHFRYASAVCRTLGIRVCNGSPASRLPDSVFPRLPIEQVLSGIELPSIARVALNTDG